MTGQGLRALLGSCGVRYRLVHITYTRASNGS